ncbi:MAG: PDZ domain-containing protein [Deltaproteobacteria bacterium]|nr:PDZ domain-containing protein [Deltaproteobacteria bacterium]
MRLEITQFIKEWLGRMKNNSALPAIDITLLRPFLILLAITILSFETTDLFYKIIDFSLTQQTAAVKNNVSSSVITDNSRHSQLQDYGIITERNLFLSTLKAVSDNLSEGGLLDSDQKFMDIDLKGTVACNSSFGFIFIEERGSHKQKLYRLGDKIGSAKLIRITRNTAILESGGREITLKIKATMEGSLLPNSPAAGRSGATPRSMALSKKTVNENLNDLKSIMNQAVVRPFLNEGVQDGYIISNIAPNSLYEKMGLQNGDIIIDINDKPMQSADNLLQMVNLMQSGSSITLNVRRNGKIDAINYSFY